jgi:hypothetical protein
MGKRAYLHKKQHMPYARVIECSLHFKGSLIRKDVGMLLHKSEVEQWDTNRIDLRSMDRESGVIDYILP